MRVFLAATLATALLGSRMMLSIHQSNFDTTGPRVVNVDETAIPGSRVLDLSDNYWGGITADSLQTLITDGQDDPRVHAVVLVDPVRDSPVPVPTSRSTWGGLKRSYTGDR